MANNNMRFKNIVSGGFDVQLNTIDSFKSILQTAHE